MCTYDIIIFLDFRQIILNTSVKMVNLSTNK